MKTIRTFGHPCPCCGKTLDAASDPRGNATPGPGDITLCLYCAAVLRFSVEMRPLLLSAEQIMALDARLFEQVSRGQAAIAEMNLAKMS